MKLLLETSLIVDPVETLSTPTLINNQYIAAATSPNTRKAYQSDIKHFEQWGGKLPAAPEIVILYLQQFAGQLNVRTLSRRLTAIKNWHIYQGFSDPTAHPAVGKTMSGISRIHGKCKQKAYPLLPEDLFRIMNSLQASNTLVNLRDAALLAIGYFGALRRSELVAIHVEHITWDKQGIELLIPQSKTDQHHEGQLCAIPYGKQPNCAVSLLRAWIDLAAIKTGPVFRRIFKNGNLAGEALTPLSVNHILQKHASAFGLPYADKLSSHSLRRGLASSAARSGANLSAIMRQGRWKQVNTVMEYIEASNRFTDNAALIVMEKESQD